MTGVDYTVWAIFLMLAYVLGYWYGRIAELVGLKTGGSFFAPIKDLLAGFCLDYEETQVNAPAAGSLHRKRHDRKHPRNDPGGACGRSY